MRHFRSFLFVLLLVYFFIQVWIGFPNRLDSPSDRPRLVAPLSSGTQATHRIQGFHLVETRGGARDWELEAEVAEGSEKSGSWSFQKVEIHFFSGNEMQFKTKGDTGYIDVKTKDIRIRGNVQTISQNGYQFFSEDVNYLSQNRILESETPIRVLGPSDSTGQGLQMSAESLKARVGEKEMNLNGQVKATKKVSTSLELKISSDRAVLLGNSQQAQFFDRVVIEAPPLKLEGPEALFHYKPESNFFDFVQMEGGVKLSDPTKYATAQSLRIEPETNRMTLSGKPRIVQEGDEMTGDQIVLLDGGRRVKVENVRARVESDGAP